MNRFRLAPAIWVFSLLALPVVLWLAGVRQPSVENAVKAPLPAIDRASLRHAATFQQIDAWLLDRFPLRARALALHGNIEVGVFHESTDPQVALGGHGWLYFVPETQTCSTAGLPLIDPGEAADSVDILARTLVASGRKTTVVIAGSKYFTHTKDAPQVPAAVKACASALDRALQQRLQTTPGGLDLQPMLDRLERQGKPVFLRKDTHWNWRGRQLFARSILDRILPGYGTRAGIHPGPVVERSGDLAKLMGITRTERDPALVASRRPPNTLKPGDVLLIGDSQLEKSMLDPTGAKGVAPLRDVLLPGQPSCNWEQVVFGQCVAQIRRAHTIVVEIVGRNIADFVGARCWLPIAVAGERMRGTPTRWQAAPGERLRADGTVVIPAGGSVTLTIHPQGGNVERLPRLLRLPIASLPKPAAGAAPGVVTMAQQPLNGPPAPCATPAQNVVGGALFLPLPANRRASDLVVTLTGPPGTRLARPQTILLDGHAVVRR